MELSYSRRKTVEIVQFELKTCIFIHLAMHAELTYRQKFYVFKQFGAPRDDIPQLRRVRKA